VRSTGKSNNRHGHVPSTLPNSFHAAHTVRCIATPRQEPRNESAPDFEVSCFLVCA